MSLRTVTADALAVTAAIAACAAIVVGFRLAVTPDPSDLPTIIVTAHRGDTWWALADPCGIDRRVAVPYLAGLVGADPDEPLHPGDRAATCEGSA